MNRSISIIDLSPPFRGLSMRPVHIETWNLSSWWRTTGGRHFSLRFAQGRLASLALASTIPGQADILTIRCRGTAIYTHRVCHEFVLWHFKSNFS